MQTPHIARLVTEGVRLESFCTSWQRGTKHTHLTHVPAAACIPLGAMMTPNGAVPREPADTFKFCSPSRSQTLTGRFAYHLGQQTQLNLNPMTGCEFDSTQGTRSAYMCSIKCGLSLKYMMLPAVLKTQNYSTHAQGKWHQGFFKRAYTPTVRKRTTASVVWLHTAFARSRT
jgi:arylsulfatase A-like enzyme